MRVNGNINKINKFQFAMMRRSLNPNRMNNTNFDKFSTMFGNKNSNISDILGGSIFENAGSSNNISSSTYTNIISSSKNINEHTKKLLNSEKGNIFENKEKVDEAITKEIASFASDYNSLVKDLQKSGNKLYQAYGKEFKDQVILNKDKLKDIGITYNADGTLNVDTKKLADANINNVKELFNSSTGLVGKIADKSSFIEKRATLDKILNS